MATAGGRESRSGEVHQVNVAKFLRGATDPSHYPDTGLPEVAFAGRSNVGKSSLMNVLLGRRNLVRVSKAPGRTREINFFQADDEVLLVDLPGYGYARVSRSLKKAWGPMMERYLLEREELAALVILVDIRRRPEQDEKDLLRLAIERDLMVILVATKADKVPATRIGARVQSIADVLGVRPSWVVPFSKLSGRGKGEIWRRILSATRRKAQTHEPSHA